METTIQILNEMVSAGVVARYAIGGAMAALFYAEPVVTEDLDVFIHLPQPGSGIVTLSPIYEFLKTRGAFERREHLVVAGTLVQLIPAYDALTEEAVEQAVERKIGQATTRVMRVEHLIAIALNTGRPKDFARIAILQEEAAVDDVLLARIMRDHALMERWQKHQTSRL